MGVRPFFMAYSSEHTNTAEAPSVNGDDVPAVTVPSAEKAGFKSANPPLSFRDECSRPCQ